MGVRSEIQIGVLGKAPKEGVSHRAAHQRDLVSGRGEALSDPLERTGHRGERGHRLFAQGLHGSGIGGVGHDAQG